MMLSDDCEIVDIFQIKQSKNTLKIMLYKNDSQYYVSIGTVVETFNSYNESLAFFESKIAQLSSQVDEKSSLFRTSNSSPRNKNFIFEIDPLLRDVVTLLNQKLYITLASCQSHGVQDDCYVDVAFTNDVSIEYFKNFVSERTLGWRLFNIKEIPVSRYFDKNLGNLLSDRSHEEDKSDYWLDEAEAIKNINEMSQMNFSEWRILRVQIKNSPNNFLEKIFVHLFQYAFLKKRIRNFLSIVNELKVAELWVI